ncbi:MAG: zinc ribbon domain-containing protein [Coriobacteriia bacterium]|nr:zinc ribbon domain-containing protein [Coriobacteriia bacterium]
MNCPQCNSPVEPSARFCENCGTPVSLPTTAEAQPVSQNPYETATTSTDAGYAVQPPNAPITPPPSPFESTSTAGKHATQILPDMDEALTFTQVKQAAAASAAIAVDTAKEEFAAGADRVHQATSWNADPYAAAVDATGGYSSYAPPQAAPVASSIPPASGTAYAQPVYAEPSNYAENTYYDTAYQTYAQPAAPYGLDNAASATGFGLAITSLVLGICGLLSFGIVVFFGVIGIVLGIIALVLRSGYAKKGLYDSHAGSTLGLAVAGIITNFLAILMFCLLLYIGLTVAEEEGYDTSVYDSTSIEQILGEDA